MPRAPKTEFLQIRLSQEDRDRIAHVASKEHLEPSTWARQILLKAVEDWEKLNLPKQEVEGREI
jgi:predicted DNA-binding protein